MRIVFWLVGLFAVAAALALLMGQNSATITLFWAPYRVDMSFNLVVAVTLMVFLLLHVALSSLALLRALPQQAHRWRLLQRERVAHAAILDALSHQLAGRYVRARSSARQALDQLNDMDASGADALPRYAQMTMLAHLMAAESSHALQDRPTRDRHLDWALSMASSSDTTTVREGALLRAVRWAIEDRHLGTASRWLGQLPSGASRRTLALRLKLKVARLAQDHTMALETARLLAKHRAFSVAGSRSILRSLVMAKLNASHDADQVHAVWKSMDATDRQDTELVLFAITRLQLVVQHDPDQRSSEWGLDWILPVWGQYTTLGRSSQAQLVSVLLGLLRTADVDASWLDRVERMQAEHPADPLLQFLAGQVFYQHKLWGKANALFKQSVRGLSDESMRAQAWIRMAELAELRGEEDQALVSWREAALQIHPRTSSSRQTDIAPTLASDASSDSGE